MELENEFQLCNFLTCDLGLLDYFTYGSYIKSVFDLLDLLVKWTEIIYSIIYLAYKKFFFNDGDGDGGGWVGGGGVGRGGVGI